MANRLVMDGPNGEVIQHSDAPNCVLCGGKMKVVSGPYGDFWGCMNYPQCKGKRPFDGSPERGEEESDSDYEFNRLVREMWG